MALVPFRSDEVWGWVEFLGDDVGVDLRGIAERPQRLDLTNRADPQPAVAADRIVQQRDADGGALGDLILQVDRAGAGCRNGDPDVDQQLIEFLFGEVRTRDEVLDRDGATAT